MTAMDNFIKYEFDKITAEKLIENSSLFLNKILKRRTVRDFSDKMIPEEVILNIIKSAASAPSGANKQPWFFYLIKDKNLKLKIREESEKIEKENYNTRFTNEMKKDLAVLQTGANKSFLQEAPYLIVVCKEKYKIINGKNEKNYYVNESTGIALGFLVAAIHFAGLATVTYTPNPMNFLKNILEIPDNLTPAAILPVGFPKKEASVPNISKKDIPEFLKIL
jgi:nitroreductase